jgi:hypothetical protein
MALAAVVLASLCACGGGSGGPSGGLFSGGRIFSTSTRMALAPIVGAPPNIADQMTPVLVEAGKERRLVLVPGTGPADYTLRGYLVASAEKKGAKISYIWDVTDAKGQRVGRVSGDEAVPNRTGSDPWSGVDSTILRSIANKTASQVAASLPHGSGGTPTTVSASPPPSGPPTSSPVVAATNPREMLVMVTPVAGAPGDGEKSLTAALKKRLSASGVKVASGPDRSAHTVKGTITLADLTGGKQSVRIDWLVTAPGGKRLGTIVEKSTIPKGSLNGPWGAIADAAAAKAATDIINLLSHPSG